MTRRAIVAIPAKDEEERVGACLRALTEQVDRRGRPLPPGAFGVVLFANNCTDGTALTARDVAAGSPFEIRVVEALLPRTQAHAGGARGAAMDYAANWLRERGALDGVILTTDADSRVSPTWIADNLAAIETGVDAAFGRIRLDEEGDWQPPALVARGALEGRYESLLTEMAAFVDPQPGNPWPHHSTVSGASIALTREMYLRIGGLPRVVLGEDKALAASLRRHDALLRFAPDVEVVTSGRMAGRAAGGVADTLRLRSEDPRALCDEALEPCALAFRRVLWRGRLRREGLDIDERWKAALRVPERAARRASAAPCFGEAWRLIEAASAALAQQRLAPADLPLQIARAERMLILLRERSASLETIEPVVRATNLAHNIEAVAALKQEKFGGLVTR